MTGDLVRTELTLSDLMLDCVTKGILDVGTARRVLSLADEQAGAAAMELDLEEETPSSLDGARRETVTGATWSSPYLPQVAGRPPGASMTFEALVPVSENAFAVSLARQVATGATEGARYNPFYVWGLLGVGKSHLVGAAAGGCR
jgi:chromosomal replication initiation ATPase DnaA